MAKEKKPRRASRLAGGAGILPDSLKTMTVGSAKTAGAQPAKTTGDGAPATAVGPQARGGGAVRTLPLDQVRLNPQVRLGIAVLRESAELIDECSVDTFQKRFEQENRGATPDQIGSVEKLVSTAISIRDHGVIQMPSVYRDSGAWVLLTGERRYWAHRLLALPSIEVKVSDKPKNIPLVQWSENVHRSDLSLSEYISAIRETVRVAVESGTSVSGQTDLRKLTGLQPTRARIAWVALQNPEILDAVLAGQITAERQIYSLSNIDPDMRQLILELTRLEGGLDKGLLYDVERGQVSIGQLRARVKRARGEGVGDPVPHQRLTIRDRVSAGKVSPLVMVKIMRGEVKPDIEYDENDPQSIRDAFRGWIAQLEKQL